MIEYILLFSLGFLTAALAALLVAPAIRGRIVHFTENRIKATTPISVAELRAQADMLKATYAAENAKLGQVVRREREKGVASEIKAERLLGDLTGERQQVALWSEQARTLESQLGVMTSKYEVSQAELAAANAQLEEKSQALTAGEARISELMLQVDHLGALLDTDKIDIAVRDTEYESIRLALNALKVERDNIRDELRRVEERARVAEAKLAVDENKIVNLQNRLDHELVLNADLGEKPIGRQPGDIDNLTESLKAVQVTNLDVARAKRENNGVETLSSPDKPEKAIMIDQGRLAETIRSDATAVSDVLTEAGTGENDQHLREEIASIAARMVALTALREGGGSPVFKALDVPERENNGRISLAARAIRAISGKDN